MSNFKQNVSSKTEPPCDKCVTPVTAHRRPGCKARSGLACALCPRFRFLFSNLNLLTIVDSGQRIRNLTMGNLELVLVVGLKSAALLPLHLDGNCGQVYKKYRPKSNSVSNLLLDSVSKNCNQLPRIPMSPEFEETPTPSGPTRASGKRPPPLSTRPRSTNSETLFK